VKIQLLGQRNTYNRSNEGSAQGGEASSSLNPQENLGEEEHKKQAARQATVSTFSQHQPPGKLLRHKQRLPRGKKPMKGSPRRTLEFEPERELKEIPSMVGAGKKNKTLKMGGWGKKERVFLLVSPGSKRWELKGSSLSQREDAEMK